MQYTDDDGELEFLKGINYCVEMFRLVWYYC